MLKVFPCTFFLVWLAFFPIITSAATDAEIEQLVYWQEVRTAILDYIRMSISPPGGRFSYYISRWGKLDTKIDLNIENKTCLIQLRFAGSPISWDEISKFLLSAPNQILKFCAEKRFYPDTVTIEVYEKNKTLVGTGIYDRSDNMIRSIPPKGKKR